ncbi:MAG: MFS transporter [Pseudomonadota bacterium]
MTSNANIGDTLASPVRSTHRANYYLAVLFIVMVLNFLDRQIIAILAEPIKQDLNLSDTQIGLMSGLSFAIFYTTLAMPIAALADRWNRSKIIAISLAIWSGMTVLCGLVGSFIQLFLARIGVGVGEAGSVPASHSLISDLFPQERRAGAFGTFGMAIPIGAFFAYAGGGWIAESFSWRVAFICAGLPGILVAALVWFTVLDPRKTSPLREAFKPDPGQLSFKAGLTALSGKRAYWHLIAAGTLVQFVAYGFGSFYGSFFVRVHGMGYAELGLKLGIMVGLVGAFASWFGGWTSNRLLKRSAAAPLNANALLLLFSVMPGIIGLHVANADLALILFAAPVFAASYYFGSTFAAIQALAQNETRAFAVALYSLIASLLGLGLGPVFVGSLSDFFASSSTSIFSSGVSDADALKSAITILLIGNMWAGLHYYQAGRRMEGDRIFD